MYAYGQFLVMAVKMFSLSACILFRPLALGGYGIAYRPPLDLSPDTHTTQQSKSLLSQCPKYCHLHF
jgi:hypothetical protein